MYTVVLAAWRQASYTNKTMRTARYCCIGTIGNNNLNTHTDYAGIGRRQAIKDYPATSVRNYGERQDQRRTLHVPLTGAIKDHPPSVRNYGERQDQRRTLHVPLTGAIKDHPATSVSNNGEREAQRRTVRLPPTGVLVSNLCCLLPLRSVKKSIIVYWRQKDRSSLLATGLQRLCGFDVNGKNAFLPPRNKTSSSLVTVGIAKRRRRCPSSHRRAELVNRAGTWGVKHLHRLH